MMPLSQHTLNSTAVMYGRGLHTGEECRIELVPSDTDTGVVFISGGEEIRAVVSNVRDTNFTTSEHRS